MEVLVIDIGGSSVKLWHTGHEEHRKFESGKLLTPDDMVKREGVDRWVPAAELPWIRGSRLDARRDNRRLMWITLALMVVGLLAVLYVQSHASSVARRVLPKGAVHAVPSK